MANESVGATLTPHFRDFLPPWVARQPWYAGAGTPSLSMVGSFRFEDPAGEVGIETHLVTDGAALYQLPMTYRGAPLDEAAPALIATARHSELGARWIYDAEADPVWVRQVLHLVRTGGASEPGGRSRTGPAVARGLLVAEGDGAARIELRRVLTPGEPPYGPGVVGLVMGAWHPDGPEAAAVAGCLAVVRRAAE